MIAPSQEKPFGDIGAHHQLSIIPIRRVGSRDAKILLSGMRGCAGGAGRTGGSHAETTCWTTNPKPHSSIRIRVCSRVQYSQFDWRQSLRRVDALKVWSHANPRQTSLIVRPFRVDSSGSRVYINLPDMASSPPAFPPVLSALRLLIISRPDDAWWSFFLVWSIRFLTISIVLRTYIVPWGLALLFSRFRVRSVSLRSIRGVYFRQGRNVWNIDRIGLSYHRPSKTQASRLTVVVQGLKLDIAEPLNEPTLPPPKPAAGHRRVPTLADFSPSPIAFKARQVIYAIYAGLEPHLRPLVRASIVFVLRVLIRCLPALTQVLDFELVSAELSLAELPDIQFKLRELGVSTKVVFTQVEKVAFKPRPNLSRPLHRRHSRFLSMVDWKSRLSDNISRTWAGAWGDTQGTASLTIHLNDLSAIQTSGSQNSWSLYISPFE